MEFGAYNLEFNSMFYLGIDWGESKCGLAIADSENRIASIYKQVSRSDIYQEISDLNRKEKIEKIIIGFNENLLKKEKFQKFLAEIEKLEIPIELENEDFSTQIAQKNLIDADRKNISKDDDVESARVILQGWIDRQ